MGKYSGVKWVFTRESIDRNYKWKEILRAERDSNVRSNGNWARRCPDFWPGFLAWPLFFQLHNYIRKWKKGCIEIFPWRKCLETEDIECSISEAPYRRFEKKRSYEPHSCTKGAKSQRTSIFALFRLNGACWQIFQDVKVKEAVSTLSTCLQDIKKHLAQLIALKEEGWPFHSQFN